MILLSTIVAFRGLIELVLWLFVGRCVLVLFVGQHGTDNAVIRMFDFLLRPVRACSVKLVPNLPMCKRDMISFIVLFILWVGMGLAKMVVAIG